MDEDKLEKLFNEANRLSDEGKWETSIAKWDEYISMRPHKHLEQVAYDQRGYAKYSIGDHAGAIADYDRALEIFPGNTAARNNRGMAKRSMGDYAGAIADYDKVLEKSPRDADAYYNRGIAKYSMSDYAGAIADYSQALNINPQHAEAYSNRSAVKIDMGDYEAALADCDQALKINPGLKSAIHNRSGVLAMQQSEQGREEIEAKYQAQLREQQEEFERKLQAKIEGAASAHEDIVKALGYETNLHDYGDKFVEAEERIRFWMRILAAAAAVIFGGIAVMTYYDNSNPSTLSSPFTSLPFVAMGSLALSPLVWYLRMLNRDKQRYLVLREDARANLTLAKIIRTNPYIRKELLAQLFDHHDKRGSANLIADWNRANISGDNPVSVENILNRGDKSGDS